MVENGTPGGHSRPMARIWAALMACAAACNQILAVPLPGNNQSGAVGAANQGHGEGQVLGEKAWREGPDQRMQRLSQPSWLEDGSLGKPSVGWHARRPLHQGPSCTDPQRDVARGQGRGRQVRSSWNEGASHATADQAEGRSAHPQRRLAQAGCSPQPGLERPDEGRADPRGHQANAGNFERRRNLQQLIRHCGRKSNSSCEERRQTKDAKRATSSPHADPPAEPSLASATTTAEVQALLAQQELRFQSMMSQMMQHMVSLQQVPAAAVQRDFTDEEMNEINAA